jgi:hypothetical protein
MTSEEGRPIEVRLVGYPVDVHQRAQEHHDGLLREFQLLDTASDELPARLLDLVKEFTATYASSTGAADEVRDAAIARGEVSVDLVYYAPRAGATDALRMARLLDDADAYCRSGQHLLSLASPPDVAEFRRWYFGEFIRQLNGEPPTPWEDFKRERAAAT